MPGFHFKSSRNCATLIPKELWVVFGISKKGKIQVFQRIAGAGREICLAFPFCLNDKIVNVIPSFPASKEIPNEKLEINESECSHKGQLTRESGLASSLALIG